MDSTEQIIQNFFGNYSAVAFAAGEVILHPDQPLEHVWYIERGRMIQYHIDQSGNKLVMNVYKSGAFVPMYLIMQQAPADFFFEVDTNDTLLRRAPKSAVLALLQEQPAVLANLYERLSRGSAGLLRRLSIHMSGSAQARLTIELLISAQRFGVADSNNPDLRVMRSTEQQLAIQAGIARETVSRELSKLSGQGLVQRSGRELIVNPEKLRAHLDQIA